MRIQINKDIVGWNDPGWALLLIGVVAALVLGYLRQFVALLPACVFHSLTGYPCFACGSTRAFSALIDGEFLTAFRFQPLFVVGCLVGASCVVRASLALIAGKRISVELTDRDRFLIRCGVLVSIVVNWVYLVRSDI